jgi:predicted RNA-binding protein YlxR (DUF448 family)/ribosomal protein L30E
MTEPMAPPEPGPGTPGFGDTEPGEEEKGPLRRCIVSRDSLRREDMLRFAVAPDNSLVPDIAANLPGRGIWIAARRDFVETAVKKHLFERAAKRSLSVPTGLADRIENMLAERCIHSIGLARRAHGVVTGFEKVTSAVRAGRVGLILAASDAAEDGKRKIRELAAAVPTSHALKIVSVLSSAEIGTAFGREHAVHAAFESGALARRLEADLNRLAGFRAQAGATISPVQAMPVRPPREQKAAVDLRQRKADTNFKDGA